MPRRRSVLRLPRGGGAAAGLAAERAGLFDGRLEIALAVAERHPALANRLAGIGFAFDAAIDGDELVGRAFDLDDAVHQNLAAAVQRDEIGGAIALAGDDDDAPGLQGDVCDQRVSDHDGGDALRHPDELGLVDIDRDGFAGRGGKGACRDEQDPNRQRSEKAKRPQGGAPRTDRHTLLRGLNKPAQRYAARPAPDMANLPLIDERTANGRRNVLVIPGGALRANPE